MKDPGDYVYVLDELAEEVERIMRADRRVPGSGHREEDRLMERYVRDRAFEGDPRAMTLVPLLDSERRRWYA